MQKTEYMVIQSGSEFALYRKLFPGEIIYYEKEFNQLIGYEDSIWLKLAQNESKEVMDKKKAYLTGS